MSEKQLGGKSMVVIRTSAHCLSGTLFETTTGPSLCTAIRWAWPAYSHDAFGYPSGVTALMDDSLSFAAASGPARECVWLHVAYILSPTYQE